MRKGEILSLEWENINFEYGYIDLLKTKTNRPRKIPLSTGLKEVFKGLERKSEYVFTNPKTNTAYILLNYQEPYSQMRFSPLLLLNFLL